MVKKPFPFFRAGFLGPKPIGSRFRVYGSKVTTVLNCLFYCSRFEIPDFTHWEFFNLEL
jgi:hypothetical protein